MRYTRLRVWVIFTLVIISIIVVLNYSTGPGIYKSSSPVTDSLLTASYPDLYESISKRDATSLTPYLTHEHPEVQEQAWRALANTPIDSLNPFIELAKKQNTEAAWFGISKHEFTDRQLKHLEQSWADNPGFRFGIDRVLGQQGNEQTLDFFLEQMDNSELGNEYQFALAIGRLINQFDVEEDEQIRVIQNAFDTENYDATCAFLYGWYRGDESRLTSVARDTLFNRWQLMGTGISRNVDQYVNKILPARTTYAMAIYYNGEQMLDSQVQLAYELATSVEKISLDNNRNELAAKILLTNANPHVQIRTLQSLKGKLGEGGDLSGYITDTMIPDESLNDAVWLKAVETALDLDSEIVSDYRDRLKTISEQNHYLLPEVLAVWQQIESTKNFLQRISALVNKREPLSTMYALQSLSTLWEDGSLNEDHHEQIRNTIFEALEQEDRGVAYTASSLLSNEDLFGIEDFHQINQSLSSFSLPEDIEVFQAFGSLYNERFEEQAKPVIDSLAALDYAPLNRSLASAGWDINVSKDSANKFLMPDWQRLWELGRDPVLTLQTEKGRIQMQLNPLTAPATVAAIDSLSRADAYDGVPFHRVVPNFVIQGGDIERNDGFGGPDFVIPTEASDQEFVRGAVGIASAGPDTEGSQYFVMHQWMPHLNGSYTRFGKVVDGMDVVDRIQEGDKVLKATWY